ncbi:hypothetical protein EOM39_00215 [Candidatus Gracilibacteria bacterium]|nr:hypothetical protein [Candidatus Gracilibacteria bacterium]
MEIIVDINNDCKNKCIFCSKNYVSDFDWKKGNTDIDKLKEKVLLNKDKKGDIYIGGVEPFNYNNLLDLVLFIKEYCPGKKL